MEMILPPNEARDALVKQITELRDRLERGEENIDAMLMRLDMADGSVKWVNVGFEAERPEVIQSMKDSLDDIAAGVVRSKNTLS